LWCCSLLLCVLTPDCSANLCLLCHREATMLLLESDQLTVFAFSLSPNLSCYASFRDLKSVAASTCLLRSKAHWTSIFFSQLHVLQPTLPQPQRNIISFVEY